MTEVETLNDIKKI